MKDCLVIGAGISGLAAARKLELAGVRVTVLDKGRRVGGRLSTCRIGEGVFDHGAQFITARDTVFDGLLAEMREAGAVYEWCRGIGTPEEPAQNDGHPRYQGTGGMSAIPKYLARGLDVRIRHCVVNLKQAEGRWTANLQSGQSFSADALICSTPVQQALDLLDLGGVEIPSTERDALDLIRYNPCIAVMALLSGPSQLPVPGALRDVDDAISFLCDNRQKGISPATAITIHASPSFSRENWTADEYYVIEHLLEHAGPFLGSTVRSASLYRWRYAQPVETYPKRFLPVTGEVPLVFAGDAFAGPRVEGAALSGMAAAQFLLDHEHSPR